MSEQMDPTTLEATWSEYLKDRTDASRDRLICHYLHLVKYVVGRLAMKLPSHIKVDDMYSTGILGLIKAIEKYDPTKKNKFETYAILLIKGAIIDELRALDWIPRSVHQKANMLSEAQTYLQQKLGREASDQELAKYLGIEVVELEELYDRVRPAIMIPLNASGNDGEDDERGPVAERIADKRAKTSYENADHNEFRQMIEKAITDLPEQERAVLVLYYYENLMLKEIGEVLGVSESRVSQIHTKAILRLKGRLHQFSIEFANMF